MSEENKAKEVEVKIETAEETEKPKKKSPGESVGQVITNVMDTLETALVGRGNSVMVRVNDEALQKLDTLVAGGICKSRSESAAFLLQKGIEGSEALFGRIESVTDQIQSLQQELQDWVQESAK
jgi:hypothetical protein